MRTCLTAFALTGGLLCNLHAANLKQLPQFTRTAWRVQDGLPENTVQAIQQASAGYLWIGTTGGGARFDGARMTPISVVDGSIFSMAATRDGSIWLGTEGSGLFHLHHGVTTPFSAAQGLTDGFVRAILEDRNGRIWVGTDNGLFWIEGDRARQVDTAQFGNPLSVHALMEDSSGRVWVGGSKLLVFGPSLSTGAPQGRIVQHTLPGAFSENRIKCMLEARDHTIWIGTVGGLDRLVEGNFVRVPGIVGTVRTMLQTSDGLFWVGTIGHGLYVRRQEDAFTRIGGEGLGGINTVLALFEDDSQQLWIGSQDGLFRMRRTPIRIIPLPGDTAPDFATISNDQGNSLWVVSSQVFHIQDGVARPFTFPGLAGVTIRNIFRDRAGTLWFGTDGGGVYHETVSGLVHFLAPSRLVNNFVRGFLESSDGTIWIATDEGVSRIRGETVENLRMSDGLAYFSTRSLLEDKDGDIWIGTERGLSRWHRGRFVQDSTTVALQHEKIWSLLETSDGSLWFGTRDHGVYRKTASHLEHLSVSQGLASDRIYQLLEGPGKRVWLSGPSVLSSFLLNQPNSTSEGHLASTVYELPESASGTQMYGGRQPSGVVDPQGNVWFPSTRGAVEAIDGRSANQRPPRIEITGIVANGQPLDTRTTDLVLPPSLSRLEISFAPLLLRPQAGVRFRYRLEGFDPEWIDGGPGRLAAYTSLPAGSYRFRVQVFEANAPDRLSETALAIRIHPHFYKTPWFVGACLIASGLLAWGIYEGRLRQIRLRFAAVIEERSRLAREMHDTVIQGCTGVSALLEAMFSLESANQPLRDDLLNHARAQVRSTIDEARQAVWNLRHNTQLCEDLPVRLQRLAAQVQQDLSTEVICNTDGPNIPLGDFAARELLMVVREAVYNAAIHGTPTQVAISLLSLPESISIEVRDDGIGFQPDLSAARAGLHYGIAGMRERVERMKGEFTLASEMGKGTTVRAAIRRVHLTPRRSQDAESL
ncbi:two-component regulator propeller domain-containing protein [Tunturibacter empetritectus]|uniref:Two-component regulator propeller domain-containing protein n=1 Tax=Tunturiibacter empetritectus TaxID=3069691 RepID=A0AAU7Z7R8_9BACT